MLKLKALGFHLVYKYVRLKIVPRKLRSCDRPFLAEFGSKLVFHIWSTFAQIFRVILWSIDPPHFTEAPDALIRKLFGKLRKHKL